MNMLLYRNSSTRAVIRYLPSLLEGLVNISLVGLLAAYWS